MQGVPGTPITGVTVTDNTVVHNDQGNPTGAPQTSSPYPECNGSAQAPGDCGEGIHLMVADNSSVVGNQVSHNSGGILLTDGFGPTDGNLVAFNTVSDNTFDCGITIAGHNPGAFVGGIPQSTAGGVFDNRIQYNSVSGNGVAGQGAGVLLATPLPGGAVYDNQVQNNVIWGNGLAGVTVHSHAPGQDLNGNVIEGNFIGTNNLDGDFDLLAGGGSVHNRHHRGLGFLAARHHHCAQPDREQRLRRVDVAGGDGHGHRDEPLLQGDDSAVRRTLTPAVRELPGQTIWRIGVGYPRRAAATSVRTTELTGFTLPG